MRFSICLLGLALVCFTSTMVQAEDGSSSARVKRPLDLPAKGANQDEEEEDAPETILFYGAEFEGDAFFWCIPAYGFCGETATFTSIRGEVTNALTQLTSRSLIDLVAYNSATYVWRPQAQRATGANKTAAIAWMSMLVPIESHCLLEAAVTTLGIAQATNKPHKVLIVMGARQPYCGSDSGTEYSEQCLMQISAANYENSKINTVYFTSTFYSGEQAFYVELAAMNGGTFRQVDY